MFQICSKLPNQQFEELPFEEAILTFLIDLGHSGEIKMITDINVNKLHQPWRSFAAVINKCLSGKSTGYDSLRLSQAQILWGMYHKKNVDYAYLLWETFLSRMTTYSPRSRLSLGMKTQLYDAILPNELTNEDIRNSKSYKEFYAIASGAEPPKTKASVKKKQVGSNMSKTPPTKGKRLKTSAKAAKTVKKKQLAKTSKAKDTLDPRVQTPSHVESTDDEDSDEEIQDANVEGDKMNEEETNEEAEVDALYKDVNVNLEGRDTEMTDAPRTIVQTTQVIEDTHVIITPVNPEGQQQSSSVSSGFVSNMLNPSPDTGNTFKTTQKQDVAIVLERKSR
ncbi:hypothetical protein Tco_0759364 [Tanacetum coccineum]